MKRVISSFRLLTVTTAPPSVKGVSGTGVIAYREAAPKTAIGVSEFRKLVTTSSVFVDKSMLVKEFLDHPTETLLLTYPRRWGKTINLDMIKTFLEVAVDEGGKPVKDVHPHFTLFAGGSVELDFEETKSLKPLKVSDDTDIMRHHGRYPVISVDFKNTKGNSLVLVRESVKRQLEDLYANYRYLERYLRSDVKKLTDAQKRDLELYFSGKPWSDVELKFAMQFLSKVLHSHFGKKVFVLVDEYDSAINHAYLKWEPKDVEGVVEIFRGIHETTFKGNPYLEKALITGVFRIAKANLFSGLNNLSEYGISDIKFSRHYGFTKSEVDGLLEAYHIPQDVGKDVKKWYNGYNIGDVEIYNPWSIVLCLENLKDPALRKEAMRSYWEESGNIDFIRELFKIPAIRSKIETLVREDHVSFVLTRQISHRDYQVLSSLINLGSTTRVDEASVDLLFSYLFSSGYLTTASEGKFRLPNFEIITEMSKKLLVYYKQHYRIDSKFFTDVTDALQWVIDTDFKDAEAIKSVIEKLQLPLQSLLEQFPKFEQIKEKDLTKQTTEPLVHHSEDIVHSVMSYIALQLNTSKIGSEVYIGRGPNGGVGRADIVIVDDAKKKAIVIELKLDGTARAALDQIVTRKYLEQASKEYETLGIGINVDAKNKEVTVGYEVNFKGSGDEEYDHVHLPYSDWFNEYYSEGINSLLKLRVGGLPSALSANVQLLDARYQFADGKTDMKKIVDNICTAVFGVFLVPYNIENRHWVGMAFEKTTESALIRVVYFDPENQYIDQVVLSNLKESLEFSGYDLEFTQEFVQKQQYDNCGAEVIEGFVEYLGGERVDSQCAVPYHSQLLENSLLNPPTVDIIGSDDSIHLI